MKLKNLIMLTVFVIIVVPLLTTIIIKTEGIDKTTGFVIHHPYENSKFSILKFIKITDFYEKQKIIKVQEIDVIIEIADSTGWNLETQNLNFGKIQPGQSSARFININNDLNQEIIVKIESKGEVKDWLSYPNEIILTNNSIKEVEISAKVPNLSKRVYTGKIIITYYSK